MIVKVKNSKFNKVMKGKRKVNIIQIVTVDTDRLKIKYKFSKIIWLFIPVAYIIYVVIALFHFIPKELIKDFKNMTDYYSSDYTVKETIDKLIEK